MVAMVGIGPANTASGVSETVKIGSKAHRCQTQIQTFISMHKELNARIYGNLQAHIGGRHLIYNALHVRLRKERLQLCIATKVPTTVEAGES